MSTPLIRPFRALRYNPEKIGDLAHVIAPPYDVISPPEQKKLYQKSPYNVIRLDLREGTNFTGEQDHYQAVAEDLAEWRAQKILLQEARDCIYLYEQTFVDPMGQRRTRRGVYALRRLERFGEGTIYPHEKTLPGPKKDRLALMKASSTQLSPVFTLFRDPGRRSGEHFLQAMQSADPTLQCTEESGGTHRLWVMGDTQWIARLNELMSGQSFLIADGHHRYETALAYAEWRAAENAQEAPEAPYRYALTFCEAMDDPGLLVLPTHRLLQNVARERVQDFLAQTEVFSGRKQSQPDDHVFSVMIAGESKAHHLCIRQSELATIPALQKVPEPLRSLDAVLVHKYFIETLLGFAEEDQYHPERVAYFKSAEEIKKQAQTGDHVAILLKAPSLEQIVAIAEAGQFMPPKTTYFYPKLPTGLLFYAM